MADVAKGPFRTLSVLNGPFGASPDVPKVPFAARHPAGAVEAGLTSFHPPRGENKQQDHRWIQAGRYEGALQCMWK
jgi:hypothetical protein